MIRHIVLWKFRPGTETEREQFLSGLAALQGVIPELKASQVVRNVGEGNYDAALISDFDSLEDLARYKADPRHPGGLRPLQVHPGKPRRRRLRTLIGQYEHTETKDPERSWGGRSGSFFVFHGSILPQIGGKNKSCSGSPSGVSNRER